MIKVSAVYDDSSRKIAQSIIDRTLSENSRNWPYGFDMANFDGGLYLLRTKQSNTPVGLVGWQERHEFDRNNLVKVGYYTIAILPEHRRQGYAQEAVSRIIQMKSAGVDRVRAMIMSGNRPSLALAGRLGVETVVKQAAFKKRAWSGQIPKFLQSLFMSPVSKGILGTTARNVARRGGAALLIPEKLVPKGDPAALSTKTLDLLRKAKLLPQVASRPGEIRPGTGVAYAPLGGAMGNSAQMNFRAKSPSFGSDKLYESEAFKGFIPKSVDLDELGKLRRGFREPELEALRTSLSKQFPKGWIVKPRLGQASSTESLLTDKTPFGVWKQNFDPTDFYMAQERMPLAKVNPGQKSLEDWIDQRTAGQFHNLNRGTKEMRVHALNGKVIPYASLNRGNILGTFSPLLPFRTPSAHRAEALVQQALAKLPSKDRNTLYGFDVGFDRAGKPFIIEANPSDPSSGASGMLKNWLVQDAVGSAIQGRLPLYVKARRGLWGAGALGGGVGLGQMQSDG